MSVTVEQEFQSPQSKFPLFKRLLEAYLSATTGLDVVVTDRNERAQDGSHLRGIPGVSVRARYGAGRPLGELVDSAKNASVIEGNPVGIAVTWRKGHKIGDSLVTMSVDDFSTLVKALPEGWATNV